MYLACHKEPLTDRSWFIRPYTSFGGFTEGDRSDKFKYVTVDMLMYSYVSTCSM